MRFFLIVFMLFMMIGCGADSDLLRENSNQDDESQKETKLPTGKAADPFLDGIYRYTKTDNNILEADYFTLNSDCNKTDCHVVKEHYTIIDNNISKETTSSSPTEYLLNGYGWQEKSRMDQCNIIFNKEMVQQECNDGQLYQWQVSSTDLNNMNILHNTARHTIAETLILDKFARFPKGNSAYSLVRTLPETEYLTTKNRLCYQDRALSIPAEVLDQNSNLFFKKGTYLFQLMDTTSHSGEVVIYNEDLVQLSLAERIFWNRKNVYDNYEVIEIGISSYMKNILHIENDFFLTLFDDSVKYGEIIRAGSQKDFYNKDAFNTIYSQLKEKKKKESRLLSFILDGFYEVGFYSGKQGVEKLYYDAESEKTVKSQTPFFDSGLEPNWIITTNTTEFRRESFECDAVLNYTELHERCEDGRENYYRFIDQTPLKEQLIFNYVQNERPRLQLENNTTLFSLQAEAYNIEKRSDYSSYKFYLDSDFKKGYAVNEDNASSLFGKSLYLTAEDKNAFIYVHNPQKSAYSSVVSFYDINTSYVEEEILADTNTSNEVNQTSQTTLRRLSRSSVSDPLTTSVNKKEYIFLAQSTFSYRKIGNVDVLKIMIPLQMQKKFSLPNELYLSEKEYDKMRILFGEIYETANVPKTNQYLNYDGYRDIENLVIE